MKHEAPANMEQKVRKLMRRINEIVIPFYETATDEQKAKITQALEALEVAMIAYRRYEMPWDSKIVDTVETIEGVSFKSKAFDTDQSVMDRARDVFILSTEATNG